MHFKEQVLEIRGFKGEISIGRAMRGSWRWHVEIYHKAPDIKALSRREARMLLTVHGADRVEQIYAVEAIWPVDLPGDPTLIEDSIFPSQSFPPIKPNNFFEPTSAWQRKWVPAFENSPRQS